MLKLRLSLEKAVVTNTTEISFKEFKEYQVAIMIWKVFPPILILTGTVGSVMSLVVLRRRRMRTSTTMFYLSVLAVIDVLILFTGLLRYWLEFTFDIHVRLVSSFACKVHVFFVYVFLGYATWILVALTVDRCICVSSPFKAKKFCTLKHARCVAVLLLASLCVINFHFFWSYGLTSRTIFGAGFDCDAADEGMKMFVNQIWPWIDFSIVCVIPFTIMIVCDCVLIRQLAVSARSIRIHTQSESERQEEERRTHIRISFNGDSEESRAGPNREPISTITKPGQKRKHPKPSSLSIMLLSVNCVFLLLTSPIVVFLIGFGSWRLEPTPQKEAQLHLGWCLVNMLQYLNNAAHFFLYCLTSPRFRRELIGMATPKNKINAENTASHNGTKQS